MQIQADKDFTQIEKTKFLNLTASRVLIDRTRLAYVLLSEFKAFLEVEMRALKESQLYTQTFHRK